MRDRFFQPAENIDHKQMIDYFRELLQNKMDLCPEAIMQKIGKEGAKFLQLLPPGLRRILLGCEVFDTIMRIEMGFMPGMTPDKFITSFKGLLENYKNAFTTESGGGFQANRITRGSRLSKE